MLFFLMPGHSLSSSTYKYASTNGSPDGNGSFDNPWDLNTAFTSKRVQPGDTLYLREGTYDTSSIGGKSFVCNLKGNSNNPITIMPYNNEKVIFDGKHNSNGNSILNVTGEWVIFKDFHFTNSNKNRISYTSDISDIQTNSGLDFSAANSKLINCFIYDNIGVGCGFWNLAVNSELYGCLIFNNGYYEKSRERGTGHNIYAQNLDGTKLIHDNFIFNSVSFGLHAYFTGESNNPKRNYQSGFDIQRNISFNNGCLSLNSAYKSNYLVGGMQPYNNVYFKDNYAYMWTDSAGKNYQLGYSNTNIDCTLENNYSFRSGISFNFLRFNKITFVGNTIANKGKSTAVSCTVPVESDFDKYVFNNNRYYGTDSTLFKHIKQDGDSNSGDFSIWRGFTRSDSESTFSKGLPDKNLVSVWANKYEKGRANVVVYNYLESDYQKIDVSHVLEKGSEYYIYDVQNIFDSPILTGTYNGSLLDIPMNLTKCQQPNSNIDTNLKHTSKEFGAFLILSRPLDINHKITEDPHVTDNTIKFKDIAGYEWAENQINTLASMGIITGTSATTYSPGEKIKRADAVVLIIKALGLDVGFSGNFSDVSKEKYYYKAVGIAKKLNIISGVGDNKFNPETPIRRQDLMVIVHNALKTTGLNIEDINTSELEKFKDASDISDYALVSIAFLVKEEIITGDANKTLFPLKNITRAETAAIIYKIY